jgi:zinc/manganese transport system substrate-binding protein
MGRLADVVASKLGQLDTSSAATFKANAAKFKSSLAQLTARAGEIKAAHGGAPVAITEPVPLYMLQAAGLQNKTSAEYSKAIEEGVDVPATVMQATTDLISARQVKLLAYNDQTAGPQTEALKTAAAAAGVPVVNFTETLPDGTSYLAWMGANLQNLAAALAK